MIAHEGSFLSSHVHRLIVVLAKEYETNGDTENYCFVNERLTYNWDEIKSVFNEVVCGPALLVQPCDWFERSVRGLWPVVHQAGRALLRASQGDQMALWRLYWWTGQVQELVQCYQWLVGGEPAGLLLSALQITATLERSLGNVYLLRGKQVPFLLRDLLASEEMLQILGGMPLMLTQLLVGSPAGINLRNIAWHGFLGQHEAHPHLIASLFVLLASVGEIVQQQEIPRREQVSTLASHTRLLCAESGFQDISDWASAVCIVATCPHVSSSNVMFWEAAFKLYNEACYVESLMLLMTQIEHMMRSIYCSVNQCPERMLTAESDAFYTTLDEILAPPSDLAGVHNDIGSSLGEHNMMMLLDLFVYLGGPRIRNKLSHGEIDATDVPRALVNHVMCISLCVALKSLDEVRNTNVHKTVAHWTATLNVHEERSDENTAAKTSLLTLQESLLNTCSSYKSKFHPINVLERTISSVLVSLKGWNNWPKPNNISFGNCETQAELNSLRSLFYEAAMPTDVFIDNVQETLMKLNTPTFRRPKSELDTVSLLIRVMGVAQECVDSIKDGASLKYKQWLEHTMKSRARLTYDRMLQTIPVIHCTLVCLVAIAVCILSNIHATSAQCIKILKVSAQFVENMASSCRADKNRWEEMHKKALQFSILAAHFVVKSNLGAICNLVLNNNV